MENSIELQFNLNQPELNANWFDDIEISQFMERSYIGTLLLRIQERELSIKNVPIAWLTWHLYQITQWLEVDTSPYQIDYLDSRLLAFSLVGSEIRLELRQEGHEDAIQVGSTELGKSLRGFCKSTYKYFEGLPPAKSGFMTWWYSSREVPCVVVEALGGVPKAGYRVKILANGKLAMLHCYASLSIGEKLTARFGCSKGKDILLWC